MNKPKTLVYKNEKFIYFYRQGAGKGWYWNHENTTDQKPSGPFMYETTVRTAIREFIDNMED